MPPSFANLENRIARMADPNSGAHFGVYIYVLLTRSPDLATKHAVATEIREVMDTTRDAEFQRVLPYLVPATVELLRSSHPSFQRDTTEYHFRRILLDIINRLPLAEPVRANINQIFHSMLNVIRVDNEENGATACKTLVDIVRGYRVVTEQGLAEFISLFQESFGNMRGLAEEYLSETSTPLDPSTILPALRSFKVLGEMGMVMVVMSQVQKTQVASSIQATTSSAFDMLALESSAQMKAKSDCEAMGNVWAGMASSVQNPTLYSDLIQAQVRVSSSFFLRET